MWAHTLKGALNEGRTGPGATEKATADERGSAENVSLKDGNVSFSALSPSGIYFTMALSAQMTPWHIQMEPIT